MNSGEHMRGTDGSTEEDAYGDAELDRWDRLTM
jgi:hypothetical protein